MIGNQLRYVSIAVNELAFKTHSTALKPYSPFAYHDAATLVDGQANTGGRVPQSRGRLLSLLHFLLDSVVSHASAHS